MKIRGCVITPGVEAMAGRAVIYRVRIEQGETLELLLDTS